MANEYALAEVLHAAREGVPDDAAKIGIMLTNAVKLKLSHPGTGITYLSRMKLGGQADPIHGGRFYDAGSPGHLHQASAPGEPPAVDTGAYRASWVSDVSNEGNAVVLSVGTHDRIGPWLEFGTTKMQSRPHIRPVMVEEAGHITGMIGGGIVSRERDKARELGGRG